MNNHVVSKCWKRMALYRKVMETRKKPRHEDPSPHEEKRRERKPGRGKTIAPIATRVDIMKPPMLDPPSRATFQEEQEGWTSTCEGISR
jgi:hypothetical protein